MNEDPFMKYLNNEEEIDFFDHDNFYMNCLTIKITNILIGVGIVSTGFSYKNHGALISSPIADTIGLLVWLQIFWVGTR